MQHNHPTLWLDGHFIQATSDILACSQSGILEEIAVYQGSFFKLHEHLMRLLGSAAYLLMHPLYRPAHIEQTCKELAKINNLQDGYIYAAIFIDSSGLNASIDAPHLMLFSAPRSSPYLSSFANKKPLNLTTSSLRKPSCQLAPSSVKAEKLLILNNIAKQKATEEGFDDALLLDDQDFITSATSSNIFLVKSGALYTPSLERCLDGITRRIVIDLALKHKLVVVERGIMHNEIKHADELFITSTLHEITAISSIGEHKYYNHATTEFLYEKFSQLTPNPIYH